MQVHPNFRQTFVEIWDKVTLFLLCMPILAAPLQSLGVIGIRNVSPSTAITWKLMPLPGFVLLGVPAYYITQKNEDVPMVFGAYKNRVDSI